jgi:translation elongation factor EF-Tu-like GTPase
MQVLASRMEEATEVATMMRSDMTEDRKRLREIEEEVREIKKKRREEELAAAQVFFCYPSTLCILTDNHHAGT